MLPTAGIGMSCGDGPGMFTQTVAELGFFNSRVDWSVGFQNALAFQLICRLLPTRTTVKWCVRKALMRLLPLTATRALGTSWTAAPEAAGESWMSTHSTLAPPPPCSQIRRIG